MVKRLRHHPFTVVTGVRFPLESPKYGRFARPYFFWGIVPLLCVLLRNPRQAARDCTEPLRASPSPIGNRCKAIPLGVTKIRTLHTSVFFRGISPLFRVLLCNPHRLHAIAPSHFVPRRSLSAIAVRRFPLESPKYGRFARPYFFGESSPCTAIKYHTEEQKKKKR